MQFFVRDEHERTVPAEEYFGRYRVYSPEGIRWSSMGYGPYGSKKEK